MKLEWSEPPRTAFQRRVGGGFYDELATELRKHPGRWAKLPRTFASDGSAQSAAGNIRRGITKAMRPAGEYEAVAEGRTVWVRFAEDSDPDRPPIPTVDTEFPKRVRAWAEEQGEEVKPGRLPRELVERYEEATGDRRNR